MLPGMDLSLRTDGPVAHIRVVGAVAIGETGTLLEYLRVARENGSVLAVLDFSECNQLPTTIVPILVREALAFQDLGGSLSLTGLRGQNPFLMHAVAEARFVHYRSFEEASAHEKHRLKSSQTPQPPTTPAPPMPGEKKGS
jgi:hypothetical protein